MKKKVAIFGGGVAGMSAAHELAERGFDVEVYERQQVYVGGKARSTQVPDSASDGHAPLPGEHGFRFFPGFYRHITDTMKRIPYGSNQQGVFDNLVQTTRMLLTRLGAVPITGLVNFPKTVADWRVLLHELTANFGLSDSDKETFVQRVWQLLTSSYERRQQVYERVGWMQYANAEPKDRPPLSKGYEEYCAGGLLHTLVAAQPQLMSTKTGGDILLQLLLVMTNPAAHADRVLNGPTNDVWLFPWLRHLEALGVRYHHHYLATAFHCDSKTRQLTGVSVKNLDTQEEQLVQADYYISAVPLERMALLVKDNKELLAVDHTLRYLVDLVAPARHSLNWMNGVQYYLNQDVPLTHGHVMCLNAPWGLTAISQPQFWPAFPMAEYGDGQVKGLLSVDVSNWFSKGLNGKTAEECTLPEIIDEVWNQLEDSLNSGGTPVIDRSMIVRANVDTDIKEDAPTVKNPTVSSHDAEPLLVNTVNSWSLRPEAFTGVHNLFLAADYVRTNTDLATMEGANEAARRAVNGIIAASGAAVPYCRIWQLHEPDVLAVLRWRDRRRFAKGLPWNDALGDLPTRLLHEANYWWQHLRRPARRPAAAVASTIS